jgi:hypothetical protein
MKAIIGHPARFLSVLISLVATMLLGTSAGWAQQKPLKGQLVGAWTLVSIEVTPKGGTKQPGFGGPNPKGILIFDAGGRYASVTGRPDRPKFKPSANLRADTPAAEFGEAARGFGANFGNWSVNEADKTLIRKYEIALIPNNDRNETKASVSLSKGELKLVQVSAAGAKTESVYQRAK